MPTPSVHTRRAAVFLVEFMNDPFFFVRLTVVSMHWSFSWMSVWVRFVMQVSNTRQIIRLTSLLCAYRHHGCGGMHGPRSSTHTRRCLQGSQARECVTGPRGSSVSHRFWLVEGVVSRESGGVHILWHTRILRCGPCFAQPACSKLRGLCVFFSFTVLTQFSRCVAEAEEIRLRFLVRNGQRFQCLFFRWSTLCVAS